VTAEITDQEVLARFPGDWVDRDNIAFFRGLLQRQLVVNRCEDCTRWYQPPWPVCPRCSSANVAPTEVSGEGVVFTYTIPHGGPPSEPVAVAVVDLCEQDDLRAAGPIVNCAPEDLRIGMSVALTWLERDGHPVPAFQPRQEPEATL